MKTDLADLDRLYQTVKAERGGLDILFASTPGPGRLRPLGGITPEQFLDQIFDVNVKRAGVHGAEGPAADERKGVVDHPDRLERRA